MTVTGYPSPADEYAAHLAAVRASYERDLAALEADNTVTMRDDLTGHDIPVNAKRAFEAAMARLATVEAERDRYKAALRQIADTDYRGNRSHESIIAYRALEDRL